MKRINFDDFRVKLDSKLGCQCEFYDGIHGDQTIILTPDQLKPVIDVILETFVYYHLSAITVQQRKDHPDEIEVFYNFWGGFGFSLMLKIPLKTAKLPSLISVIPGADFYEREAAEMFGIEFTGRRGTPALLLPDEWDQGPPFISEKEKMDKISIPIGPQHPLLKEPLSMMVDISGEKVLGGSLRLGYVHRGIERLAQQRTYVQNIHLIERICGICSHIHTTSYCYAVEALLGVEIPPRAQYIRALMCELERIHSHLLWLGILAKHIGLDTIFMHTWHDREMALDIMEEISGGRVSHAANQIGGVRFDLDEAHDEMIKSVLKKLHSQVESLLDVIETEPAARARTKGVAPISPELIKAYGVVGPVARASGVDIDMRRDAPLPPYDQVEIKVITHSDGDAWARTYVRAEETRVSLNLCETLLRDMPKGDVSVRVPRRVPEGEVIIRSEAPRGELFYYLRSDGSDKPARLKIRTPTLSALSLLPVQLSEINVADIPVVLAGVDLCIACADR